MAILDKFRGNPCVYQLYDDLTLTLIVGNPCVCQLYDYGVNQEYCYMVMKRYKA